MDNAIWVAVIGGASALLGASTGAWATFVHEKRRHDLAMQQELARRALDREQQTFETERELYKTFTLLISETGSLVRHMVGISQLLGRFDASALGAEGQRARLGGIVEQYVALRPELRRIIAHLYLEAPDQLASVAANAFTAAEQVCAGIIFGADAPSMDEAERVFGNARDEFNSLAKQKITLSTGQPPSQSRR
ncbi:hypothetical protein G6045_11715 [Streptomyces sp. YC504]|uniref:Uncharacterized protein n=1 Tax=Streptomyces mesophilus TaxID=1775132 RepID=A0A6G4XGL6_9ACTN|nr:hypothetical protein [Streptomyces mesophilus]NGO76322.1 hypothetical protein [Streptomyces mesophilus]